MGQDMEWFVGVSAVDITPPVGLWMSGYALRDKPAQSAIHPLWVKALVLKDKNGTVAVMVGCDIIGFPREVSERIKSRVEKELKIPPERVLLNSSHTHSGPVIEKSLVNIYPLDGTDQLERIKNYTAELEDNVFQCIAKAVSKLIPANLYYGKGIARFAVNRRNNKPDEIENVFEFRGPVDYLVPVLFATSVDNGSMIAIVCSYACHGTVLADYYWCGDYPGFAQIELQNMYPGAVSIFLGGCGADIDPMPRLKLSLARQYGKELACAVETVIEDNAQAIPSNLSTSLEFVTLELEQPIRKEELERIANDPTQVDYKFRSARYLLRELAKGRSFSDVYDYPVQVWNLGGIPLVALGGEVVVDYAKCIKSMLGNNAIVLGYSNDVMAYIPSVRVLHEGGYEGGDFQIGYMLPSKWKESIQERILSTVQKLWHKVKS